MDYIGNFKTSSLIRTIIIIYAITQALISGIFYGIKLIDGLTLSTVENWQFYLSKVVPILAVSGVLYFADKFFDKLPKFSSLLFEVPNLKGYYEGVVKQKDGNNYKVTAEIIQTLSTAEFTLNSPKGSITTSETITYVKDGLTNWKIFINYKNFNSTTPEDPKDYYGTCKLTYNVVSKKLTGTYYTSRQIFGTLELQKNNNAK